MGFIREIWSDMGRGFKTFIILYIIIGFILLPSFFIYKYLSWDYPISRDVWDKLDRAQISAESGDMLYYVNGAITSLEQKRGLFSNRPQIEGHCALIFKKPSNDLSIQYKILKNIRTRLERTNTFDRNSIEYQTAIDDIRGTIREVPYRDCWIWHFD